VQCGAVRWEALREGDVDLAAHDRLAELLRAAYADQPELFPGRRTWSYLRPEARVIGTDAAGAVAHTGVLRRFLQVGGHDQLVAVVGLVAVRPGLQRHGVGAELLGRVGAYLTELAVPFGILMCAPGLVGFYRRAGWRLLEPVRSVYSPDDTGEARPFVDEVSPTTMVLPVTGGEWPGGELQWHAAQV
jgi:nodulation protein A